MQKRGGMRKVKMNSNIRKTPSEIAFEGFAKGSFLKSFYQRN